MPKAVALIYVGAEWEKASTNVKRLCEAVSKETGVTLEVKEEDYDFLMQHGQKDEFGGINIPQVFVKYEDGSIKHVMDRIPLTNEGKSDNEGAARTLKAALSAG